MDVTITMVDGQVHEFKHQPRAGGSYDLSVSYEGGMVVVTNEYGDTTSFVQAHVDRVQTRNERRF